MHRLSELSLKNRSFIALVCIAVSIIGIFSMTTMRQELIPSVSLPQIQVMTSSPGSSSEQVQDSLTKPIEQSVRGIEDVKQTSSTSQANVSIVTIELDYGTDVSRTSNKVDAALSRIEDQLPDDADPQVISGGSSDLPAQILSISSDLKPAQLSDRLDSIVVPEMERVDGVSSVQVVGAPTEIVRLTLDDDELKKRGLSEADITTALDENGLSVPGGTVTDDDRTLDVVVGKDMDTLDDLKDMVVLPGDDSSSGDQQGGDQQGQAAGGQQGADGQGGAQGGDQQGGAQDDQAQQQGQGQQAQAPKEVTRLKDVAKVERTTEDATSISRTNGRESLILMVTPTADGNIVDISKDADKVLDDNLEGVGGDAKSDVVFDQAPFIKDSITSVAEEGLMGLAMAIIVILLFLRRLRPTIVTAISIPTSLLIAFIGMLVTGYTLNMLTLAALTISIGRVVDDSIVVIENITRHLTYGKPRRRAIVDAVREVAGAITASTLATVLVFLPIALVGDLAGELFRPFALTVAIAMLSSLVVALTIVPVLAYWFLRAPKGQRVPDDPDDAAQVAAVRDEAEQRESGSLLHRIYTPVLRGTQNHRVITLVVAVAILVGSVFLYPLLKVNFLGDSGQNLAMFTQTLPEGTDLAQSTKKADKAEKALEDVDGVDTVQTTIGSDPTGMGAGGGENVVSYMVTTDPDEDQEELSDTMLDALQDLPAPGEIEAEDMSAQMMGGSSTDILITGPTDKARQQANDAILDELDPKPSGVEDVTSDLEADRPTAVVTVDREKAGKMGLSEQAVVGMVAGQLYPGAIGQITIEGTDLDIKVDQGKDISSLSDLKKMKLMDSIPLTDVAEVSEQDSRPSISTKDGLETVTVSLTPSGDDNGPATEAAQDAIDDADLPEGTKAELGGTATDISDTFGQLALAMLAAVLLIYVLLVWIFKSLIQPLVLLVSIPFAAVGAFGLLLITQVPLGLPSMIGLLMLVGIVVTNAIVLIDLVNQYRRQGMGLDEAIMTGASKRLRPILMTAAATIFALIPMSLGITGNSGFISQPLAVVVIGGLISSTLLTLVIVPVLYGLTEGPKERRRLRREAAEAAAGRGADGSDGADGGPDGPDGPTDGSDGSGGQGGSDGRTGGSDGPDDRDGSDGRTAESAVPTGDAGRTTDGSGPEHRPSSATVSPATSSGRHAAPTVAEDARGTSTGAAPAAVSPAAAAPAEAAPTAAAPTATAAAGEASAQAAPAGEARSETSRPEPPQAEARPQDARSQAGTGEISISAFATSRQTHLQVPGRTDERPATDERTATGDRPATGKRAHAPSPEQAGGGDPSSEGRTGTRSAEWARTDRPMTDRAGGDRTPDGDPQQAVDWSSAHRAGTGDASPAQSRSAQPETTPGRQSTPEQAAAQEPTPGAEAASSEPDRGTASPASHPSEPGNTPDSGQDGARTADAGAKKAFRSHRGWIRIVKDDPKN
jgi:HAE1 family hydrophobic/amphiphilic exporter-1